MLVHQHPIPPLKEVRESGVCEGGCFESGVCEGGCFAISPQEHIKIGKYITINN